MPTDPTPPSFQKPSTPGPPPGGINPRSRAYGIAMELAFSIIGMTILGWLIDRWANSTPLWTLIGAAMGAFGGFYNFLKKALALNREEAAAYNRAHPKGARGSPAQPATPDDLFGRKSDNTSDENDFDVPPDLESTLERRLKQIEAQEDDSKP